ncbi:MAG: hypothetical protein KIS66_15210 [Fimbriimonadaceae bacterium]|nr:hypothetical protein [Fimbriimonadaceae bacterium]
MRGLSDFQRTIRRSGAPVSVAILAALVVTFLLGWLDPVRFLFPLVFDPASVGARPWSLLTWVLCGGAMGPIGLLFAGMWLWGIGGIVEREMTSRRFAVFALAVTLLTSLLVWVGGALGIGGTLAGAWVLLVAITVAWATRHPEMPVSFMLVLPMQARWLAWISVALLFFAASPMLAPLLIVPQGLVYLFASNRIPGLRYQEIAVYAPAKPTARELEREKRYLDDVKRREADRADRDRLRKLFEASLVDDPDKPGE